MTPKVEFHFDFGSPNAYFVHKLIPQVEQRTGAKFTYVPILLGGVFKLTNNQPPMVQFKDIKNKQDYQRLEIVRFVRKHGLTQFKMNPHFPVNTVQIMRGAVAAELDGQFAKYVDAVFHHMWEEGKKMDDPKVIRAALDRLRPRRRAHAGAHPGPGGQGQAAREHGGLRRARHFRRADLLRRRRDLLRQGPPARRRGGDRCREGAVRV